MKATPRNIIFSGLAAGMFVLAAVGSRAIASDSTSAQLIYAQAQQQWCQGAEMQATTADERAWAQHCLTLAQRVLDSLNPVSPSPSGAESASPTRSPSMSPTLAARSGCLLQPSACGYPDATNTGVTASTALTAVNADVKIYTEGAVVEGKDIHGCVHVAAKNVTIRRSKITGTCYYMIISDGTATGLTVEDVEITCSDRGTGIANSNIVVRRANIHGCENGLDVGSSVTVVDSWIHDGYNSGDAHGDGIQTNDNGTEVLIKHNTITNPGGTSAIITARNGMSNYKIEDNLLDGGAYTVYCPYNSATGFQLVNNRFGTKYAYGPMTACGYSYVTATGNVWDTTGLAVPTG